MFSCPVFGESVHIIASNSPLNKSTSQFNAGFFAHHGYKECLFELIYLLVAQTSLVFFVLLVFYEQGASGYRPSLYRIRFFFIEAAIIIATLTLQHSGILLFSDPSTQWGQSTGAYHSVKTGECEYPKRSEILK